MSVSLLARKPPIWSIILLIGILGIAGCTPNATPPPGNPPGSPSSVKAAPKGELVTISGNVREQVSVAWSPELTVTEVIGMAGGVGWDSVRRGYIVRGQERITIDLNAIFKNLALDPKLLPGDKIEVR